MYLPDKEPSYVTRTAMSEDIVCLLGGRVAEQLVLEDISTGASNDLERATDLARSMVTRYGFSERLGPVVYGSDPNQTFLGRDLAQGKGYSEMTASEIDNEIRDIMDESYESARRILSDHMDKLHAVAQVLTQKEKISGDDFRALMEGTYKQENEDEDSTGPETAEPSARESAVDTPAEETPVQDSPEQE